jgi:hypothetical protein
MSHYQLLRCLVKCSKHLLFFGIGVSAMHKVDGEWRPDPSEWECSACGWINQPGDHACVCVLQADDRERRRRAALSNLDSMGTYQRRRHFAKWFPSYMVAKAVAGTRYLARKRTGGIRWIACPIHSPYTYNYPVAAYRVPISARVTVAVHFR